MVSEAHKRATKKYKATAKIKNWQVDLKENDFTSIEERRKQLGLTRAGLLKKIIEEEN